MIYYLGTYLEAHAEALSFLRLVDSISFRAICGAITALLLTILLGGRAILLLYRRGQRDVPRTFITLTATTNQAKAYGGALIVAAVLASALLWCRVHTSFALICLAAFAWFAALGAVDDVMKVRHGNSVHGLSERAKLAMQLAYGLVFGLVFVVEGLSPLPPGLATHLYVPFLKAPVADLSWAYVPFVAFTVVAIANAVNLADGIDGLAVMPVSLVVAVYGVFAYVSSHARISAFLIYPFMPGVGEVAVICSIVFGACLGFLWFNSYPANVIMGDTGSMALGGLLGTVAVLVKQEFLFMIVGGVFVGEAFSSLVQEKIGVRWLGRRYFERAPLHDHFRVRGLADTKIVVRFWIVAGILALCGLATLKVR
ncbi:MAG: phospho-N-acetylmuramoyl-pentapeptide-transferase [Candidatus Latescibacterota bacterium]